MKKFYSFLPIISRHILNFSSYFLIFSSVFENLYGCTIFCFRDLGVDVARLKLMKASHQSQQYKLEDSLLKKLPEEIEKSKGFISGLEENSIVSQPIDSVYKKRFPFQIYLAYQDLILYNNYIL